MQDQEKIETRSVSYFTKSCFDIMDVVVSCLVLLTILGTLIFKTVVVSGNSMRDTLHDGDKMILTSFLYTPKNGDIVVIPKTVGVKVPIIKRVIATAGQTLKINFSKNEVYVDGKLLDEPYISTKTIRGTGEIPEKIPENCVFVMGDNRSNSMDSRYREVGLINVNNILGKAHFIISPFDRFGSPY